MGKSVIKIKVVPQYRDSDEDTEEDSSGDDSDQSDKSVESDLSDQLEKIGHASIYEKRPEYAHVMTRYHAQKAKEVRRNQNLEIEQVYSHQHSHPRPRVPLSAPPDPRPVPQPDYTHRTHELNGGMNYMTENFRHQQRAKLEEERRAVQDVTRAQYMQRAKEGDFVNNEAADGKTHLQNSLTLPTEVLREKKLQEGDMDWERKYHAKKGDSYLQQKHRDFDKYWAGEEKNWMERFHQPQVWIDEGANKKGEKKKTFVKDHRDGSEWNKQFGHTHDKNRQMSKQERDEIFEDKPKAKHMESATRVANQKRFGDHRRDTKLQGKWNKSEPQFRESEERRVVTENRGDWNSQFAKQTDWKDKTKSHHHKGLGAEINTGASQGKPRDSYDFLPQSLYPHYDKYWDHNWFDHFHDYEASKRQTLAVHHKFHTPNVNLEDYYHEEIRNLGPEWWLKHLYRQLETEGRPINMVGNVAELIVNNFPIVLFAAKYENRDKKMNGLVNSHRKKYNVSKDAMISFADRDVAHYKKVKRMLNHHVKEGYLSQDALVMIDLNNTRAGLKVYSDLRHMSPLLQLPQMWFNGRLLGGYETIKRLEKSRRLGPLLTEAQLKGKMPCDLCQSVAKDWYTKWHKKMYPNFDSTYAYDGWA